MTSKILSKENFYRKIDEKREKLLEQRDAKIEEEILWILKWIDVKILSEEDKKIAKSLAEKKHYPEDDKLSILGEIQKHAEENHYWDTDNFNWIFTIFSDVTNDIVYQKMVEKKDTDNIKLFNERKLSVETYLKYLTDLNDEEIKDLWIEEMYLLREKLQNMGKMETPEETPGNTSENTQEEKTGNSNSANWKTLSETNLESIGNALQYFIENWIIIEEFENIDDIINKIKYKIYRKSWISTKNWWKEEFLHNDNWIEIEKSDIPSDCKAWDTFQVYCASASTGWFITVKLKWKKNDSVNLRDSWRIDQVWLSEYVINKLQTIKEDIENIFNHDKKLIEDFVNTFIKLRNIWYKSLKEEFRKWMSIDKYKEEQWWNDLSKHLKEMQDKNKWLENIIRDLWELINELKKQGQLNFEEIKNVLLKE